MQLSLFTASLRLGQVRWVLFQLPLRGTFALPLTPPHFHARYGDYKGIINIHTLKMIEGELPRRALSLILDWAELHQQELLVDWDLCINKQKPHKIEPLK